MSSVGSKGVIIQDALGGDAATVTNQRLDVNAQITVDSSSINIGNVELVNTAGVAVDIDTALTDSAPNLDSALLLGTHALLQARSDSSTTLGLTCEDGTHNALHVSISDGAGIAHVNANNQLDVSIHAGDGTSLTHNSGKLDVCLHASDGTELEEVGSGALKVSIVGGTGAVNNIGTSTGIYVFPMGMEYAEFDGSALPFAAGIATEGEATPMQGSKYGIQYIMPVNEDGSKSPIDQTSGQMITTHGITGMVSDGNNAIGPVAPEQLDGSTDGSYSQACKRVDLQAALDNTGYILVGDNGLVSNLSGGGIKLNPGDFYSIDIDNVGDIYVLAEDNGDGIFFNYFT